ncbi:hypothetical protein SPBR_01132 [Sporothrix brasiliensis 5110]|uniref:Uncharacterized protein n=1 Tax=Sporothrix brasiliensis 5110 TaxID=1398154 RepID=A0A0C2ISP7_9PEZI|nr:uncharacterized protein SPBR_01132 [Sporothrix brasiliensis 5110]KIH89875.1 hypothetical protein SPBR_01132 [Sporothrix brasiliensis 5110]
MVAPDSVRAISRAGPSRAATVPDKISAQELDVLAFNEMLEARIEHLEGENAQLRAEKNAVVNAYLRQSARVKLLEAQVMGRPRGVDPGRNRAGEGGSEASIPPNQETPD